MTIGLLRRSISGGSSNRKSQARASKHASLRGTLCPPGQSKKAIGPESPIGPCIATHRVDNRPACCFRKRLAPSQQRNGTTGKRKRISVSHAETNQDFWSEQDHSQSKSARSNSWAECRDKKGPASSRGGDFSLDIPLYRTFPVLRHRPTVRIPIRAQMTRKWALDFVLAKGRTCFHCCSVFLANPCTSPDLCLNAEPHGWL